MAAAPERVWRIVSAFMDLWWAHCRNISYIYSKLTSCTEKTGVMCTVSYCFSIIMAPHFLWHYILFGDYRHTTGSLQSISIYCILADTGPALLGKLNPLHFLSSSQKCFSHVTKSPLVDDEHIFIVYISLDLWPIQNYLLLFTLQHFILKKSIEQEFQANSTTSKHLLLCEQVSSVPLHSESCCKTTWPQLVLLKPVQHGMCFMCLMKYGEKTPLSCWSHATLMHGSILQNQTLVARDAVHTMSSHSDFWQRVHISFASVFIIYVSFPSILHLCSTEMSNKACMHCTVGTVSSWCCHFSSDCT